jgi:hypothetical protein
MPLEMSAFVMKEDAVAAHATTPMTGYRVMRTRYEIGIQMLTFPAASHSLLCYLSHFWATMTVNRDSRWPGPDLSSAWKYRTRA